MNIYVSNLKKSDQSMVEKVIVFGLTETGIRTQEQFLKNPSSLDSVTGFEFCYRFGEKSPLLCVKSVQGDSPYKIIELPYTTLAVAYAYLNKPEAIVSGKPIVEYYNGIKSQDILTPIYNTAGEEQLLNSIFKLLERFKSTGKLDDLMTDVVIDRKYITEDLNKSLLLEFASKVSVNKDDDINSKCLLMKNSTEKIFFPMHPISVVELDDVQSLENISVGDKLKPYGETHVKSHPERWHEEFDNVSLILGSHTNNNLDIQPNEVDFYNEILSLIVDFYESLSAKLGIEVEVLENMTIFELEGKARKEVRALISYFKVWLDVASVINWSHTGNVVIAETIATKFNLTDRLPFDWARNRVKQLQITEAKIANGIYDEDEDDTYTESDSIEDGLIRLFTEEDMRSEDRVRKSAYSNFSSNVVSYVVKGDRLTDFAEAIVKLFRWGARKPKKLKTSNNRDYLNLQNLSVEKDSGDLSELNFVKVDGEKTKFIYRFVVNKTLATRPADNIYFTQNLLATENIPIAVILAEVGDSLEVVKFTLVDFISFKEDIDKLGVAFVKFVGGKLVFDEDGFDRFKESNVYKVTSHDIGCTLLPRIKTTMSMMYKNNRGVKQQVEEQIYSNVNTTIDSVSVDITRASTVFGRLKTLSAGEVNDSITYRISGFERRTPKTKLITVTDENGEESVEVEYERDSNGNIVEEVIKENVDKTIEHFYQIWPSSKIEKTVANDSAGTYNAFTALSANFVYDKMNNLTKLDIKQQTVGMDISKTIEGATRIEVSNVREMIRLNQDFKCLAKATKHVFEEVDVVDYAVFIDIYNELDNYKEVVNVRDTEVEKVVETAIFSQPKHKLGTGYAIKYTNSDKIVMFVEVLPGNKYVIHSQTSVEVEKVLESAKLNFQALESYIVIMIAPVSVTESEGLRKSAWSFKEGVKTAKEIVDLVKPLYKEGDSKIPRFVDIIRG